MTGLASYDSDLFAAADRHMSSGDVEGVGVITVVREWLGFPHVELRVEAECYETVSTVLEACVYTADGERVGCVDLAQVAPNALRVSLTGDEMGGLAMGVAEAARDADGGW